MNTITMCRAFKPDNVRRSFAKFFPPKTLIKTWIKTWIRPSPLKRPGNGARIVSTRYCRALEWWFGWSSDDLMHDDLMHDGDP
jgi:hypothetical protein